MRPHLCESAAITFAVSCGLHNLSPSPGMDGSRALGARLMTPPTSVEGLNHRIHTWWSVFLVCHLTFSQRLAIDCETYSWIGMLAISWDSRLLCPKRFALAHILRLVSLIHTVLRFRTSRRLGQAAFLNSKTQATRRLLMFSSLTLCLCLLVVHPG